MQVVPPVPVYMKFYFFAVDNPDEVSAGERPNVTEVGPYVYRETRRKEDLLTVDNDKLYYSTYMEYHFDQVNKNTKLGQHMKYLSLYYISSV